MQLKMSVQTCPSLKEQRNQRKKIRIKFMYYLIGMVFMYSGYTALYSLQSSVNIEQGLGEYWIRSLNHTFLK